MNWPEQSMPIPFGKGWDVGARLPQAAFRRLTPGSERSDGSGLCCLYDAGWVVGDASVAPPGGMWRFWGTSEPGRGS